MATLLRLLPFYKPYRWHLSGAYLSVAGQALFTLLIPSLLGLGVDRGIAKHNAGELMLIGALILLSSLMRGLCAFAQGYLGETSSQGVSYQLRNALYKHIQDLSFSFHDQAQTGELMARATSDVEALRMFCGRALLMIFNLMLLAVGVSIALLKMNWMLAVLSAAVLPLLIYRTNVFARRLRPMYRGVQDQIARLATVVQENAQGVRVIKAFGREDVEIARADAENDKLYDRYMTSTREMAFNAPLLEFMSNASTVAMLFLGGWLVIHHSLSYGQLVAFYSYLLQLLAPIRQGGQLMAQGSRAAAAAERIFEMLDTEITLTTPPNAIELSGIRGRVQFDHVSCAYRLGRPVLEDVDFTVEPGQMVALVGATGSGKTTIANLIPRFYDVTGGQVLIDGHDVREVTQESLRRQVGVVMQETTLFSGTIRDNIAFGRPDATEEMIQAAARAARAEEFIARLPKGYDTVVGERGVSLSGGQKQRVAIARALMMDPRILILDEFTSAVDVATERLIRAALLELMRDRTTFVIAHRISTVRAADRILVLEHGRVVAAGQHDELLASSEAYREIHGSQLVDPEAEMREAAAVATQLAERRRTEAAVAS
ncbi:MAG TPA: ABC transporter ATP-binding protein [Chloroflexota bacterium]|nr:ABC transporter ATP-binding protein [Chloroflexota bacterium]